MIKGMGIHNFTNTNVSVLKQQVLKFTTSPMPVVSSKFVSFVVVKCFLPLNWTTDVFVKL